VGAHQRPVLPGLSATSILLEGAWALMNLWGIATVLRAGRTSPIVH
jgi:hypothetical protein